MHLEVKQGLWGFRSNQVYLCGQVTKQMKGFFCLISLPQTGYAIEPLLNSSLE